MAKIAKWQEALLRKILPYISRDDVNLERAEFIRYVADRIDADLEAQFPANPATMRSLTERLKALAASESIPAEIRIEMQGIATAMDAEIKRI
jgi:hypothetical protein